jgi:hypothetical protein
MTHVELISRPQQTIDIMFGRDGFIDKIEASPFAAVPPDVRKGSAFP